MIWNPPLLGANSIRFPCAGRRSKDGY